MNKFAYKPICHYELKGVVLCKILIFNYVVYFNKQSYCIGILFESRYV